MGLQAAPQMADQFGGLHPDSNIQNKVQEVGTRLVQQSVAGSSAYKFSFNVLKDAQTVNAFALPGGPIFITAALLNELENEAQLAGVWDTRWVTSLPSFSRTYGQEPAGPTPGWSCRRSCDRRRTTGARPAGSGRRSPVSQMVNLRYGRQDELNLTDWVFV
jgi:hypothetical protein